MIAMIARAFARQTPFEVWGDGTQIRNGSIWLDLRMLFRTGLAVSLGSGHAETPAHGPED